MEENLIIENELYNSFHTRTHCCNLWLGHGRILALVFFLFFLLMPLNRFRLLYATQQPHLFFLSFLFFPFFHLYSGAPALALSLSLSLWTPHTHLFLSGINQIVTIVFYETARGHIQFVGGYPIKQKTPCQIHFLSNLSKHGKKCCSFLSFLCHCYFHFFFFLPFWAVGYTKQAVWRCPLGLSDLIWLFSHILLD